MELAIRHHIPRFCKAPGRPEKEGLEALVLALSNLNGIRRCFEGTDSGALRLRTTMEGDKMRGQGENKTIKKRYGKRSEHGQQKKR